jgi:hypothetical protein
VFRFQGKIIFAKINDETSYNFFKADQNFLGFLAKDYNLKGLIWVPQNVLTYKQPPETNNITQNVLQDVTSFFSIPSPNQTLPPYMSPSSLHLPSSSSSSSSSEKKEKRDMEKEEEEIRKEEEEIEKKENVVPDNSNTFTFNCMAFTSSPPLSPLDVVSSVSFGFFFWYMYSLCKMLKLHSADGSTDKFVAECGPTSWSIGGFFEEVYKKVNISQEILKSSQKRLEDISQKRLKDILGQCENWNAVVDILRLGIESAPLSYMDFITALCSCVRLRCCWPEDFRNCEFNSIIQVFLRSLRLIKPGKKPIIAPALPISPHFQKNFVAVQIRHGL